MKQSHFETKYFPGSALGKQSRQAKNVYWLLASDNRSLLFRQHGAKKEEEPIHIINIALKIEKNSKDIEFQRKMVYEFTQSKVRIPPINYSYLTTIHTLKQRQLKVYSQVMSAITTLASNFALVRISQVRLLGSSTRSFFPSFSELVTGWLSARFLSSFFFSSRALAVLPSFSETTSVLHCVLVFAVFVFPERNSKGQRNQKNYLPDKRL